MKCIEVESLLADYLDGILSTAERTELEAHLATCAGCADFLADVNAGFELTKRSEEIQPPADLITRIAYQAPIGRIRRPSENQSWLTRAMSRWVQPILQPKFAMGMAMTILSFAMMERCTGVRVQRVEAADLNPIRIATGLQDRVVRTRDRAVKYYENIRFVYDIEVRLRDMEEQQTQARAEARRRQKASTAKPQGGSPIVTNESSEGDKK